MKESSCSFDDKTFYESTCDILWQRVYHICHLGYFHLQIILYNIFG